MEKRIPFNINSSVYVRLTDKGLKTYQSEYGNAWFSDGHKPDGSGWSKFQLWELMNLFGKDLYNGREVPFETDIELAQWE